MKSVFTNWVRRILGDQTYINLRSTYSFRGLNSPFPLHRQEDFEVNWDFFEKPQNEKVKAVYIISPTQRSGTNFLNHLLIQHPDLIQPNEKTFPTEQFLFTYIDDLKKYSYKTVSVWNKWTNKKGISAESQSKSLLNAIGDGILNYYMPEVPQGKTLLLKTPDAGHIEDYFHLFPKTRVLLLIRDGRDTVSSFTKSWGGDGIFKKMSKRWKNRMDGIETFIRRAEQSNMGDRILTVRFNDLNANLEKELKKIFKYLELKEDAYPWKELDDVPVLGSSSFRGEGQNVHWDPVQKSKEFNPNQRWKTWSRKKKKIFKQIAGKSLERFGFEQDKDWCK